jgi:ribosomal protein S18 acetylase RimI-like enzyme
VTIRALQLPEAGAAAAMLGRAFRDNPAYRTILAHLADERRGVAIERVKRGFVRAVLKRGIADVVESDGKIAAASLVLGPGDYPFKLIPYLWRSTGCLYTGARGIYRFLRADSHMVKRHYSGPHYYLFVLGVAPEQQGRGLGKSLLIKLNERADRDKLPCYLETDKETNVRIYQSAGYRVVTDELVTGVPGLRFWTMLREARQ